MPPTSAKGTFINTSSTSLILRKSIKRIINMIHKLMGTTIDNLVIALISLS